MALFAERVNAVEYAIRDLVEEAKKLEKQGRKIVYVNIGDPLKYDFAPPAEMVEALYDAAKAQNRNFYTDSQGDRELREAIAEKEKRINKAFSINADDVVVTSGVSEAIFFLCAALIEKGDEALLGGPGYPPYIAFTKLFGGVPVYYRNDEGAGWQPDISDVEKKITPKTKFLLSINPNNPTGAVLDKKALRELIDLAAQHDLIFVSDEIYDLMAFDGEFTSAASLTKDVPIVGFNGFSKSYLAPGWRLGYAYFANADERLQQLKENMLRFARIRLCASTPAQRACIPVLLGKHAHVAEVKRKLKERGELSYRRLNEIDGLSAAKPKGAFYIFPRIEMNGRWRTDKEFVLDLLNKQNVLTVNGSGFGGYGESHFRIVFLPQPEVLNEVYDRIDAFMKSRK